MSESKQPKVEVVTVALANGRGAGSGPSYNFLTAKHDSYAPYESILLPSTRVVQRAHRQDLV